VGFNNKAYDGTVLRATEGSSSIDKERTDFPVSGRGIMGGAIPRHDKIAQRREKGRNGMNSVNNMPSAIGMKR